MGRRCLFSSNKARLVRPQVIAGRFIMGWTSAGALVLGSVGIALFLGLRERRKRRTQGATFCTNVPSPWESRARVAAELAVEAGKAMVDTRARSKQSGGMDGISYKGRHDLVTATDKSNEDLIRRGLQEAFPEDDFLGEEASAQSGGAPSDLPANSLTWICDPIDGTTNFVHGFPVTCVSIALAKGHEIVVGVIYNPFSEELYQSVKGSGAFLNGNRLEVSRTTSMDQALVVAEYSCCREEESVRRMMETTGAIACAARAVRQTGCGAMDLCFLARGSVDAIFAGKSVIHSSVAGVWKPWDWAAGVLIAKEAGAVIFAGDGGEFRLMGDTMLGAASAELASCLEKQLASSWHGDGK
ncbi:unnamed protein product [Ascophyllum nodosum]